MLAYVKLNLNVCSKRISKPHTWVFITWILDLQGSICIQNTCELSFATGGRGGRKHIMQHALTIVVTLAYRSSKHDILAEVCYFLTLQWHNTNNTIPIQYSWLRKRLRKIAIANVELSREDGFIRWIKLIVLKIFQQGCVYMHGTEPRQAMISVRASSQYCNNCELWLGSLSSYKSNLFIYISCCLHLGYLLSALLYLIEKDLV